MYEKSTHNSNHASKNKEFSIYVHLTLNTEVLMEKKEFPMYVSSKQNIKQWIKEKRISYDCAFKT